MKWALHFGLNVALIGVALMLCASLFVIVATHSSIYSAQNVPTAEAALLPGASITSQGVLSPVLRERADEAALLYTSGKVSKILVTGDDSTLTYDEVYPVGKYLAAKGIPQKDIFLDYAGFDTYSSMYRAKDVFDVQSAIVVSQRFHLPRALFIAHSLGIIAYGVDVSEPGEDYFLNALREIPAASKAIFDLLTSRIPKYLGQQFPITGDGATTWVGSKVEMVYFMQ